MTKAQKAAKADYDAEVFKVEEDARRLRAFREDPIANAAAFVYVVLAPETGFVKIGFARDVAKRVASLQAANPTRLIVLTTTPMSTVQGARDQEAALHRQWAHYRTTGEWFVFDDKLRAEYERFVPKTETVAEPELAAEDEAVFRIIDAWDQAIPSSFYSLKPHHFREYLDRLTEDRIVEAIIVTANKQGIAPSQRFSYFRGVLKHMAGERSFRNV